MPRRGRVVPDHLVDARQTGQIGALHLVGAEDDLAVMARDRFAEGGQRRGRDLDQADMLACADVFLVVDEAVIGERRGDHRHLVDDDRLVGGDIVAEAGGGHEAVEAGKHVDPLVGLGQPQLQFGVDAGGAVGVHRLEDVVTGKLDDPGLFLKGGDAQLQDVAGIAEGAVANRSDAADAAGNEAAHGRGAVGGRTHAQFLTGLVAGGLVDGDRLGARLHDDRAGANVDNGVELGKVEYGRRPTTAPTGRNCRCRRRGR